VSETSTVIDDDYSLHVGGPFDTSGVCARRLHKRLSYAIPLFAIALVTAVNARFGTPATQLAAGEFPRDLRTSRMPHTILDATRLTPGICASYTIMSTESGIVLQDGTSAVVGCPPIGNKADIWSSTYDGIDCPTVRHASLAKAEIALDSFSDPWLHDDEALAPRPRAGSAACCTCGAYRKIGGKGG